MWNDDARLRNEEEAAMLWKLAAEQSHVKAQYQLALCYLEGRGVQKNERQAEKYFRQSDEQGYEGPCVGSRLTASGEQVRFTHRDAMRSAQR